MKSIFAKKPVPTSVADQPPKATKRSRDPDAPYKVREAAAAIGMGESTLFRLIQKGVVRTIPFGSESRIPAAEVRRIKEQGYQLKEAV